MSTHNSTNPFLSLDKSRFRKNREEKNAQAAPPSPPVPEITDESALFLAAMAGTVHPRNDGPPPSDAEEEDFASLLESGRTEGQKPPRSRGSITKTQTPAADDTHLFAKAMDEVTPLRSRGRDIPPPAKPPARVATPSAADDFFSSSIAFSLEYTDEYLQGHILGLDPVILGKLRSGAYSHEGHVDLHGHNMEQAYARLVLFIKHAYQDGKRHLLIVTGRGRNSPGGTAVLRERVQAWLTRDPFKRVVLAFCTAKPGDGGAGALYVLLRKRKKGQGKIIWDKNPCEEDLLL